MHEFKYYQVQIQGENTNKLEFIVLRGVSSRRNCKTYPVKYLIKEGFSRHSRRTLLQADKFPLAGVSIPDCKYVSAFKSTSAIEEGGGEGGRICVLINTLEIISHILIPWSTLWAHGGGKRAFSYISFLTTVSTVKS